MPNKKFEVSRKFCLGAALAAYQIESAWGPRFLWERYRCPIFITENGLADNDWIALDGEVHDPQREDYIARHLLALQRALSEGVDLRGYFYWSLLDNLEWTEVVNQRFGLVYVDFPTQPRILKQSARFYRRVIEANAVAGRPCIT